MVDIVLARALARGAIGLALTGDANGAQALIRELEKIRREGARDLDRQIAELQRLLKRCDADGTTYGHGFAQEWALGSMEVAIRNLRARRFGDKNQRRAARARRK